MTGKSAMAAALNEPGATSAGRAPGRGGDDVTSFRDGSRPESGHGRPLGSILGRGR